MMSVQIGQEAPNFKAKAVCGDDFKDVSLTDYRGKWVLVNYTVHTIITTFTNRPSCIFTGSAIAHCQ